MVAAAEGVADLGQAVAGELPRDGHGHLPRPGDRAVTPFGEQVRHPDLVIFGHGLLDVFNRDLPVLDDQQVFERLAREVQRDRAVGQVGIGDHAV